MSLQRCDEPKSKGGINFLDLKAYARSYNIEFPKNIRKRELCKLINEVVAQARVSLLTSRARPLSPQKSKRAKSVGEPPLLTSRYRLLRKLGAGSFGQVWQAIELATGHMHALKILTELDLSAEREVATLIDMSRSNRGRCHKNVLCYVDQFSAKHKLDTDATARVYEIIVTEMIVGTSLEKWRDDWYSSHTTRPSVPVLQSIARGLLRALALAHSHGIYHLDVKPENIMMRKGDDPVLIDFGISCTDSPRLLRESDANSCQGVRGWGTAPYMSPQYLDYCHFANRLSQCDAATRAGTDIWAAGLVLLSLVDPSAEKMQLKFTIAYTKTNTDRDAVLRLIAWLKKRDWLPSPLPVAKDDPKLAAVIESALTVEQEQRPSAKQLLAMLDKK